MNVFSSAFLSRLLLATAVLIIGYASAAPMSWRPDGTVLQGKKSLSTKLQPVDTALVTAEGIFLAGSVIDKGGENLPYIGFISTDLSTEKYWPQSDFVQQFYRYGGQVHALQMSGISLVKVGVDWANDSFVLRPHSVVISTGKFLIACNPRSAAKESQLRGSCYDVAGQWALPIHWQRVTPRVCEGKLIAVDEAQGVAKQIDLSTGEVLVAKSLPGVVEELCSIDFFTVNGVGVS